MLHANGLEAAFAEGHMSLRVESDLQGFDAEYHEAWEKTPGTVAEVFDDATGEQMLLPIRLETRVCSCTCCWPGFQTPVAVNPARLEEFEAREVLRLAEYRANAEDLSTREGSEAWLAKRKG